MMLRVLVQPRELTEDGLDGLDGPDGLINQRTPSKLKAHGLRVSLLQRRYGVQCICTPVRVAY
jgi:hypothetical protein